MLLTYLPGKLAKEKVVITKTAAYEYPVTEGWLPWSIYESTNPNS